MVFYGLKKIFITDQEDRAYTRLGFCVRDLGFGIRDQRLQLNVKALT